MKRFKSALAMLAVALMAVALFGCGAAKKAANELDGTTWVATSITDTDGSPYLGDDLDLYEVSFTEENIEFSCTLDIHGYISGAGETYRYTLEDKKLSIEQGLGNVPVVIRYSGDVIEIKNPDGVLFHFEKKTQSNSNAESSNSEGLNSQQNSTTPAVGLTDGEQEIWHIVRSVKVKDGHPTSSGTSYDWSDDFTYSYCHSGDSAISESYYEDGQIVHRVRTSKSLLWDNIGYDEQKYTYDDQGRVKLIEYFLQGELVGTEENVWEADGSHMGYVHAVRENNEVVIEYEYDSSDRLIRKTPRDEIEERYIYEIDSQDRVLKKETHVTVSGKDRILYIDEYVYNEDGTVKTLLESENYYFEETYITWQTDFDYDEYGNQIHKLKHYISDTEISFSDDEEYYYQYISESGKISGEIPE